MSRIVRKKINITLCTINYSFEYDTHTPLSLQLLYAAILDDQDLKKRVEIKIRDYNSRVCPDNIISDILSDKPDIVGFACYIWNLTKILSIAKFLKENNSALKIVLGGPEVSPIAGLLMKQNPQIDFIVRNEGEVTFRELVKKLFSGRDGFDSVKGISFKSGNDVVETEDREIIENLDLIPSPFIGDYKIDCENRLVDYETMRGCVYRCHYCYYHLSCSKLRYFSVDRVKKDLAFLLKKNLKSILVTDSMFNADIKRSTEILKFIAAKNKKGIPFVAEIRAELVNKKYAGLLADAGFEIIEIGIQSTDKEVLKRANRHFDLKKFKKGLEYMQAKGINCSAQLIFGLPGDTKSKFLNSLRDTLGLKPSWIDLFKLMVLPGTDFWENSKKYGLVFDPKPMHEIIRTRTISRHECEEFARMNIWFNYLMLSRFAKMVCKGLGVEFYDFFIQFFDWTIKHKIMHRSIYNNPDAKRSFAIFAKEFVNKNASSDDKYFYFSLLRSETGIDLN
jgi:radical SAM superfamily enzyme YgiQ (UPF0313 family)